MTDLSRGSISNCFFICRRRLALSYLELTRQEVEYVTLTRDTTEADLKQRREIRDATSYYHDQVMLGHLCCEGVVGLLTYFHSITCAYTS